MIWSLFCKDLRQHARPLLGLALSALALPLAFVLLTGTAKDSAGYAGVVFGYLGISSPLMFAQWFVGQEKLKGTFQVLRLLPVSGAGIIATKCICGALLSAGLINIALVLEPAVCRSVGITVAQPPLPLVLWCNMAAVLSLGVSMLLFTAFDTRIAVQAVIWTFFGLMILSFAAQKYLGARALDSLADRAGAAAGNPGIICLVGAPVVLAACLLFWCSARLFERKEWGELEED